MLGLKSSARRLKLNCFRIISVHHRRTSSHHLISLIMKLKVSVTAILSKRKVVMSVDVLIDSCSR